jgi:uncharacterized membrane protein
MEGIVILLVLLLIWLVIAPIVALVKAGDAKRESKIARDQLESLRARLHGLENELHQLKNSAAPVVAPRPAEDEAALRAVQARVEAEERRIEGAAPIPAPPPLPMPQRKKLIYSETPPAEPPPLVPEVREEPKEPFSLEKFMGVKLFAWLGGVAMFFGVVFFVKYAFENNLIPPSMRIALGFVTGTGLLIGGILTHRLERYRVLAQAFCATGVLILYGVSFAAHAVYRFPLFGTLPTFGLMALITFAAFLIAVRLNALVVAVLGMLGGFLTPILLSTGRDQVLGLFGYIALLDIGLLAVSRHGKWRFLTPAAAVGTVIMQMGWYHKFFTVGRYFEGSKTLVPMGILVAFIVLFLAGGWIMRKKPDRHAAGSLLGLSTIAMLFAAVMLNFSQVSDRYPLLYGFVLLVNLAVMAVVMTRPQWGAAQVIAAGLTFLHLACWTSGYLTKENLMGALVLYLTFGALHAVVPVILQRRMPERSSVIPLLAGPWCAPLILLMMTLPLLELSPLPMAVWAAVLAADLLIIGLAVASGALIPVLAALVLTMWLAVVWLLQVPAREDELLPILAVVTGFSAVFVAAGKWLFRGMSQTGDGTVRIMSPAEVLPVASAALPFGLLVLALTKLPVANPSPVFGVALLMTALLAGLAILGKHGPLVLGALAGTLAVEGVWHLNHFQPGSPAIALSWYLGFYALFLALPFVFRKACAGESAPWTASALSGVGHFLLVHNLVKRGYPNEMMGLIPAAFAIPALIGLVALIRNFPTMDENQRSRVAWFGGVALFFITLIFPIQFQRQWITVSWAIEGALLLWLFRRVAHPGLQLTGLALLAISFIRLTLNPAVFTDYPRSGTPILNWHLYAYGLVAAAQFFGAAWFIDPVGRWKSINPRGVLQAFGGVLLFLLLNIEIADFFTAPGHRSIAFNFGGNFARDTTYSIAWGLFSLALLGIGFWRGSKHARYAATGLLVVTLLKVFIHDLAAIENVFRIGALVGVAVIAFIASFLYQRFFDRSKAS